MLIFVIIGFGVGLYFGFAPDAISPTLKSRDKEIFGQLQTKHVEVTEFFTYGKFIFIIFSSLPLFILAMVANDLDWRCIVTLQVAVFACRTYVLGIENLN